MPKKGSRKKLTEYTLTCSCGAKVPVVELANGKGFMSHCAGCGNLSFFKNASLLTRLSYGGQICPHNPQRKPCPGGETSWCDVCRVRCFFRRPEATAAAEPPEKGRLYTETNSFSSPVAFGVGAERIAR